MEILDIYDENRKLTGKTVNRNQGKILLQKGEYVIQVKCWILNDKNEILLTQRRKDKYNGGMWEPTGGLVITGETSIQAIQRELYEEIGIKASDKDIEILKSFRDEHFFRDIYIIRSNISLNDLSFIDKEVINAKYVTISEFEQMINDNQINEWNREFIETYNNLNKGL